MDFLRKAFTILIGFIHDFATGCWAATLLAIFWLDRQTLPSDLTGALFGLKKQFFYSALACIAVIFATGAGRTFTYVSDVYGPDAERIRRKMLIIKHIILLVVFGLGTYWQYTMVFR
jgi:putative copper export protein